MPSGERKALYQISEGLRDLGERIFNAEAQRRRVRRGDGRVERVVEGIRDCFSLKKQNFATHKIK